MTRQGVSSERQNENYLPWLPLRGQGWGVKSLLLWRFERAQFLFRILDWLPMRFGGLGNRTSLRFGAWPHFFSFGVLQTPDPTRHRRAVGAWPPGFALASYKRPTRLPSTLRWSYSPNVPKNPLYNKIGFISYT